MGQQDLQDTLPAAGRTPQATHQLIVIAGGRASVHPLPVEGAVLLGRSSFADIPLDDPSISRRHAMMRIGVRTTIEDLGSANGTRVKEASLTPGCEAEVLPGDPVELGAVTVVFSSIAKLRTVSLESDVVLVDPKMKQNRDLIERVAPSRLPMLLLGETGVGKEVMANQIHRLSGRSGPFLELNCAAISETLLESELFGFEEGAFTGAAKTKQGLLESAEGGTVFLDEIGELPSAVQVKLLRVLESRQVMRVGALRSRSIDVRFVAATNRNLDTDLGFRRDLYFRLAGITIVIPPLRDRRSEIEPLARFFLGAFAQDNRRSVPALSQAALQVLEAHAWPGNVRELKNTIERAALLADEDILPAHLEKTPVPMPVSAAPRALRTEVAAVEKTAILEALERSGGNQSEAAKLLGISRRTLGDRMDAFGIPRPRKKNRAEA